MYLEEYYHVKGQFYINDKNYFPVLNFYVLKNYYLQFIINIKKKKDKIIVFLLFNFLKLIDQKIKANLLFILKSKYESFLFFNNFVLIWLIFSSSFKNIFLAGGNHKQNLLWELKGLPSLIQTEKLIEINDQYIKLFKQNSLKLIIFKKFLNFNHRESFSRFLKLPINQ